MSFSSSSVQPLYALESRGSYGLQSRLKIEYYNSLSVVLHASLNMYKE